MRDLLRGRITGRLDWRAKIRAAGLPEAAERVVLQVVTRTRLWRAEKVEVAAELIAHFTDAIDAGAAADEVARSFGDPKRAAKLIGRAKRRGRSLAWRALHVVRWINVWLLVLYGALAVRFFIGRATPTVDYVAQLNAAALRTPEDQRAWPIYRRAILAMRNPTPRSRLEYWPKVLNYNHYGKHWPEMKVWLRRHASDLELVRAASEKRRAGDGDRARALPPPAWALSGNPPSIDARPAAGRSCGSHHGRSGAISHSRRQAAGVQRRRRSPR